MHLSILAPAPCVPQVGRRPHGVVSGGALGAFSGVLLQTCMKCRALHHTSSGFSPAPCVPQVDGHMVLYQVEPWAPSWESNPWYWQYWQLDDHRFVPYTAILEVRFLVDCGWKRTLHVPGRHLGNPIRHWQHIDDQRFVLLIRPWLCHVTLRHTL